MNESTHEYNIEDITDQEYLPYKQKVIDIEEINDDDDPLNVLEKWLVTKATNLHVTKNTKNKHDDFPNSLNILDISLLHYFDTEEED